MEDRKINYPSRAFSPLLWLHYNNSKVIKIVYIAQDNHTTYSRFIIKKEYTLTAPDISGYSIISVSLNIPQMFKGLPYNPETFHTEETIFFIQTYFILVIHSNISNMSHNPNIFFG